MTQPIIVARKDDMKPKKSKTKKRKVATLKVPAAYYDEALAFVNERRKEMGRLPITALPAGYRFSPTSCPCAKECGGEIAVYGACWWWYGERGRNDGPSLFVSFFDVHAKEGVLTLPIRSTKTKEPVS